MIYNTPLTIKEILEKYPNLPKKFLVKFALFCANDVRDLMVDNYSVKALDVTQLWLDDKATIEEVSEAGHLAFIAVKDRFNDPASNAAYEAILEIYAPSPLSACYAAYYASYARHSNTERLYNVSEDKYRDKLLEMIDELDEMEQLVYLR